MSHAGGFDLTHVGFAGKRQPAPVRAFCAPRLSPAAAVGKRGRLRDERRCDGFPNWVLRQAGIDPGSYRAATLDRRVPACLRALKVASEGAARQLLAARPRLRAVALDALLIGVTDFFRDPAVFERLRSDVLPALARQPRRLRVWSAGCSNGAEAYSLAMLLDEAGLLERSEFLGSDCRGDAIEEAAAGIYPLPAVAALPAAVRERRFTAVREGWRVDERLRRTLRWTVSDLSAAIESGPWDLVLCRNVVIYMTAMAATRTLESLEASLRPGAFLVLGQAEAPAPSSRLSRIGRCIYQKGDEPS